MTKKIIFIFLFCFLIFSSLSLSVKADYTTTGLNETANEIKAFEKEAKTTAYDSDFMATRTGLLIGLALSFIGVLFLGLMIYAGIIWMTAGGNEQTVSKSKDMIVSAIIGLIIILGAYAITKYIGDFVINPPV